MRLKLFLLWVAALVMTACSDTTCLYEPDANAHYPNAEIEFKNYVAGMTRASKIGSDSFVIGESMGVWGYQTTGEYTDTIFNNQKVDYIGGIDWTYTNKKLWNIGSTYKFYGLFPYSTDLYEIGDENKVTITGYVNPSDPSDQQDLMISEVRAISPFNTVDMLFHHILSNVNVLVKISNNFNKAGVSGVTLQTLRLSGVKNTGTFIQGDWEEGYMPTGKWSDQSGSMNIADVHNVELKIDGSAVPVLSDYIMIPQQLFSTQSTENDVTISATFRVHYIDGTSSTFVKNGIRLAGIAGRSQDGVTRKISSWDTNCRYNYVLAFNPAYSTRIWDADGDGSLIIDPETGDTISKTNDTPTPGTMKYDPDNPSIIKVFEDTDDDGIPDTWVDYPIVWENIDDDDDLEAGLDRDGDGHIDDTDNDNQTNQPGNNKHDPTDGNPNNPDGKDCILLHVDTDGDGVPDTWIQLEKDPTTGEITPERETDDTLIEFAASVSNWDESYTSTFELE